MEGRIPLKYDTDSYTVYIAARRVTDRDVPRWLWITVTWPVMRLPFSLQRRRRIVLDLLEHWAKTVWVPREITLP